MTVFTAALECATSDAREACLDAACDGRPELRERVEALLRANNRCSDFLSVKPIDEAATIRFETSAELRPPLSREGLAEELRRLLRSRLILVHLLSLGYVALLTVLSHSSPPGADGPATRPDRGTWWRLCVPLAESVLGALVLWRSPQLSMRSLRIWEAACFGILAAFYGMDRLEALAYQGPEVQQGLATAIGLAGLASLQGFVTLVLAYGVLIPNTRGRSLIGVAALACVPLAVIPLATRMSAVLQQGHAFPLAVQWAVILMFPASIAVFAASRAAALQRRAFEAERRADRLGRYTLRQKLGEGGMGEVWLAEHGLLRRPCAVKFIRPELACNPATAARFAREVQAVTALTHVNTVRVYDYGRADDGSFYLVMEYLDGPTLEELVRASGPLAPGRVVHLLRQICGALTEAHAAGLIHRDLKPGNVIVANLGGQQDVAKLLDFGLVQDLSADADGRLTRTGTVLGTPAYMSPEQASGEHTLDARSDVYSLGAMAFYALTGRPPFQGKSIIQVLEAHRSEAPPSLIDLRREVSEDLARIVTRCLSKSPADRYASARELGDELAQYQLIADSGSVN